MAGDGEMQTLRIKTRLLKLLMSKPPMDSADAWAHALAQLAVERGSGPQSQELNPQHELFHAIQDLVPRLPEYKTVEIPLVALLEYCQHQYPVETDTMAQIWLERAFALTSMGFRRWLVEWLHAAVVPRTETRSQWTKALQAAVASVKYQKDEDQKTKRMLLQVLHRLKDTPDNDPEVPAEEDPMAQAQAISTVEELLDFYWCHADALATSALLCAAKLSALLDSTAPTQDRLNLKSTVSVRLRWALVTKPDLFEGLLHHITALKVLPVSMDSTAKLRLSPELQAIMDCVCPLKLTRLQDQYECTMAMLKDAHRNGVKHLHQTNDIAHSKSLHGPVLRKLLVQWSSQQKEQLVADLARDLAIVPPYLVPAVFTPLSVYLSTLLLSEDTEERDPRAEKELVVAVNALFKLLRRASDATICYLVLAFVLQTSLAQNGIWRSIPSLFTSVIRSLSESLALDNDRERSWIVTMTLQQFLFECDTDVLRISRSQLAGLVPQKLERLIHVRLE